MPTAKALREQRAPLVAEMRKLSDTINAEKREFSAEENERWVKINADYDRLSAQIQREEKIEAAEADQKARVGDSGLVNADIDPTPKDTPKVTETHRALALSAWCASGAGRGLTQQQREACRLVGFNPNSQEIDIGLYSTGQYADLQARVARSHPTQIKQNLADFRADLSIGSGPSGGYLQAPEAMVRNLEINMLAFGGVRQVAEAIRTSSGERFCWPTADDTTNTGAQLGEAVSIGSSVDPSFAKVFWDAYKFSSKVILVPFELLQDSVVNLPTVIGDMLGERLGRITNTKFTTGTGAATPKGIVTAATTYSAASATALAADDLINLVHQVDPAYRAGAGMMMHDSIVLTIRKLKDGNGQYLWQSGLSMGAPDRLLGYAITINQDMDSTHASGKKVVLFGRLSQYKIRTVGSVRLRRLDERYADTDQVAFIAFTREDGNLLTAGTAPIKILTH